MLQNMRERMQGIIAGAIVGLICLTFALWGIQNYLRGGGAEQTVAKINGKKISQEQVNRAYERIRQQMAMQLGTDFYADQKAQQALKTQALDSLIKNEVLASAVDKLGFYVGARELNSVLMQMPIFQINGQFSPERFQSSLSNLMYSESDFLTDLRRSLLTSQLSLGIEDSAIVLPNELDQAVALLGQKRDFSYFLIKTAPFLANIKVTNEAINDYYQKHQADFMTEESVSVDYLQLDAAKIATGLEKVSDEELKQFYKDNIDNYTTPKKWQLERILLPLTSNATDNEIKSAQDALQVLYKEGKQPGADFAKLAPGQNKIVVVTSKQLDSAALAKINQLLPGEVSEPFRTEEGFGIVKLLKVEPAKVALFADVKSEVHKAYVKQKQLQIFNEQNDKLAELTYTNSDSLVPAAKALGLTVQTSEVFTRSGLPHGIAQNPKIVKTAFSDTVLKQGFNSSPIELDAGNVMVLRIKKHNPAALKPLTEVREQIVTKIKMAQAEQKTKQLAEEVTQAYQKGENLAALSRKYNLTAQAMSITGYDHTIKETEVKKVKNITSEIIAAAFSLPNPQESKQPAVNAVELSDGSRAIVFVHRVILADPAKASQEQKLAVAKQLRDVFGEYYYDLLVNKFFKAAKIKKMAS